MDLAFDLAGSAALATPQSILGALYHSRWRATAGITIATGVSVWANATAAGNLLQAVVALQPAYEAAGFNGGPSVAADGINDTLTATLTGLLAGQRPYMWLVLQKIANVGGVDYHASLVDAIPNGPAYLAMHSTPVNWLCDRGSADGAALADSGVGTDNNRHLIEIGMTASGIEVVVIDGTRSGGSGAIVGALGAAIGFLQLFAVGVGGGQCNSRIADITIASNEPSATQLALMRAYYYSANFPGYTGASYGLP
jgi:hypothetical protein